jgi:hypothetical protein
VLVIGGIILFLVALGVAGVVIDSFDKEHRELRAKLRADHAKLCKEYDLRHPPLPPDPSNPRRDQEIAREEDARKEYHARFRPPAEPLLIRLTARVRDWLAPKEQPPVAKPTPAPTPTPTPKPVTSSAATAPTPTPPPPPDSDVMRYFKEIGAADPPAQQPPPPPPHDPRRPVSSDDTSRWVQTVREAHARRVAEPVTIGTDQGGKAVTLTADERNRHTYAIGKTGSGKSSLLRNIIMQDMAAGRGIIYLDPHGDTAQTLLGYVPPERINDVIYFCPTEPDCPAFNILGADYPPDKLTRDLVSAFRMFFGFDASSAPRLSQLLTSTILLLLLDRDHERHALADVRRVLIDPDYRTTILDRCRHDGVKQFWTLEFPRFPKDAALPVLNKFSDLLMPTSPMERLFSSTANALNIQSVMDGEKILLVNLSKGELGEAGAFLIGALIVTAVNQAALARAGIPEADRKDVYLYVDEFQNFVVDSFKSILSEARKYRLNLTLAHQYLHQVPPDLQAAIFGNVSTVICLPISASDATTMQREMCSTRIRRVPPDADTVAAVEEYNDNLYRTAVDQIENELQRMPMEEGLGIDVHDTARERIAHRLRDMPDSTEEEYDWPTREDFLSLGPLSGFVKIHTPKNVRVFTFAHPKERPREDIRTAILDRQRREHAAAAAEAAEKKRRAEAPPEPPPPPPAPPPQPKTSDPSYFNATTSSLSDILKKEPGRPQQAQPQPAKAEQKPEPSPPPVDDSDDFLT